MLKDTERSSIDTDGSTSLTDPVTVAQSGPQEIELLGTAPNPASQRATVRYGVSESESGSFSHRQASGDLQRHGPGFLLYLVADADTPVAE